MTNIASPPAAHTDRVHRRAESSVQERVVVHRVVAPVDEQVLPVHAEPGGLGDVGREDLDVVPGEDRHRRAVLGTDQDGLALPLPQVAVLLDEVVQPRPTGLVVREGDLAGPHLGRDVRQAVLRQDHAGTHVGDVRIPQRDEQHGRVVLTGAVVVLAVEPLVTRHPEGLALHLIDRLTLLGVRRHGGGHALEGAVDLFAEGGEPGARGEREQGDGYEAGDHELGPAPDFRGHDAPFESCKGGNACALEVLAVFYKIILKMSISILEEIWHIRQLPGRCSRHRPGLSCDNSVRTRSP